MPETEESRPGKGGPQRDVIGSDLTTSTSRYVCIPVSARRAHKDWSNAERSGWFELLLAAYEHRGYFESLDLVRVLLSDVSGLDSLITRGELLEVSDGWTMPYYWALYDSDGKFLLGRSDRKSREERLAEADAKLEKGERLTDAEYQARHRGRLDGEVIPFAKPRNLTSPADNDNDDHISNKEQDDNDTNGVRPDVSLTSDAGSLDTLYNLHEELVGYLPTPDQQRTLRGYVRLAKGRVGVVEWTMRNMPNPKSRGWLGLVGDQIKAEANGQAVRDGTR